MLKFNQFHNPRENKELLNQFTGKQLDLKRIIKESEQLFDQCQDRPTTIHSEKKQPISFSEKIKERLFRLAATPSHLLEPTKMTFDHEGNVIPDWKDLLDQEYVQLNKRISQEVNVLDFGAVGDGKTDCTHAFKQAIGTGRVKVIVPAGVFITKEIKLPSWTSLVGAGKGLTTIKLHNSAPKGTRLITNTNHWKGNHHIHVQGLSLDWNVERLGEAAKTSTWGNHSSCLTFANVTFGWIKEVEGINPGLHCFDISSTQYNYGGDGFRARGGSKYIWLDQLTGYGFGDDGITTHHSDYIFISNSHMCDPSGRTHQKGFSNSNGIEIDDGSRNVLLVNNSSARCFGGVEIKAHQNSSAASNVQIVGHLSVNDNRSFNFRHIGHHKITDSESKTAYNIIAMNLVSIAPIFTDLYKDSAPRGMVVSAYRNVVVNHFTVIGDPNYDFKGNPVIAIQYRARNVAVHQVSIKEFKNAGTAIKIYGGEHRADSVQIYMDVAPNSTLKSLEIGKGVQDVKFHKGKPFPDNI